MIDVQWEQWPASVPRPTPEELKAAEERYRAEMDRAYANGYMGDAGMGLSFMMATYGLACWWDFFFPTEKPTPLPGMEYGLALKCRPSWYEGMTE